MAFVTDTFTDTAGTLLTSHTGELGATWAFRSIGGSDAAPVVSAAGRLRTSSGSAYSLYYASGVPATAEYDVSCDLYVADNQSNTQCGPAGRVSTSAGTGYVTLLTTGGTWQMYKIVSGGFTLLGSFNDVRTASSTYAARLEIRDAAKKLFVVGVNGGAALITSADNAITAAGQAGIYKESSASAESDSTGLHVDNFSASNPAAAGGPFPFFLDQPLSGGFFDGGY